MVHANEDLPNDAKRLVGFGLPFGELWTTFRYFLRGLSGSHVQAAAIMLKACDDMEHDAILCWQTRWADGVGPQELR